MKHLAINDNLFLVQQPVKTTTVEPVKNTNHIWIIDRSGSMYSELPRLIDDLKVRIRSLNFGDIFSFAWFSSEGGDYSFVIKGFKITETKDFTTLDKIFDANKQARNMTCFSEVLENAVTVISDLTIINPNFSLLFFTDGYPVVSNYAKEVKNIGTALKTLSAKVNSALLVGYGSYFNKELMGNMAETIGGALVSSRNLHTFAESLDKFLLDAGGANPKTTVTLEQESVYPFAIALTENNVVSLAIENEKVSYSPIGKDDAIYYLTERSNDAGEYLTLSDKNVRLRNKRHPLRARQRNQAR